MFAGVQTSERFEDRKILIGSLYVPQRLQQGGKSMLICMTDTNMPIQNYMKIAPTYFCEKFCIWDLYLL